MQSFAEYNSYKNYFFLKKGLLVSVSLFYHT